MDKQFYIYLSIMSFITYAIRAIPLVFINKKITNPTIQSFLDYIPYTVLAAMTSQIFFIQQVICFLESLRQSLLFMRLIKN